MKTKITLLVVVAGLLFGFTKYESSGESKIKEGMVKVAIFYQNGEGNTFDMDYYTNKHMPMAAGLFGDKLKAMVIDKGLGGGAPDSAAPYVAVGYFYFADLATCQSQMGTHSEALRADVSNYTNIQPVLQISEVVSAD
ncbi:EthD family reductase [Maribacter sp. 2308TA10-17]|uniref:EthD family reductase n=1 Tax=Maribacter sp. 2308TA10-17 TaxID=3386276 RepID=UPI0039BC2E0D